MCFPVVKTWFSSTVEVSFRCKETISSLGFEAMEGFGTGFSIVTVMAKKAVVAAFTVLLALGGALVGTIVGAMKGQTTETGFLRGSGIGAVTGAITAVQLLESVADGQPLSKVALLLCSLVNGKVFMEWVSPAVLKAYQWQISTLETTHREISDIYDTAGVRGLSLDCIQELPEFVFQSSNILRQCAELCCSICLQDFNDGDWMREIPNCGHFFHSECLDKWLARNGSCPMCRKHASYEIDVST